MTSLTTRNVKTERLSLRLIDVVKKQFFYKLRTRRGFILSLILYQTFIIIFSSVFSTNMVGGYSEKLRLNGQFFLSNNVLVVTFIWAFVISILLTTTYAKQSMYPYITNKWANDFSDRLVIVFYSVVAGVTSLLSTFALHILALFIHGSEQFIYTEKIVATDIMLGIFVMTLYTLLVMMIGYFIGECVQVSKKITFAGLVIIVMFSSSIPQLEKMLLDVSLFFIRESNMFIFVIKVIFACFVLVGLTRLVGSRLEAK